MQAAGVGVVVHGRGLVERAAVGDLDAQLSGVDAADQIGELAGVAANEDPLRADPRSGSCGPRTMVPTWKPPSATTPMRASVCSGVVLTRLSTTSNGAPSTSTGDRV